MAEWKPVCRLEEIPLLGSRIVNSTGGDVAVFRTASGDVFALRDHCSHGGGSIARGLVHGNQVTCPKHGWRLRLDSGEAVAPDEGCSRRYLVRVERDTVLVAI